MMELLRFTAECLLYVSIAMLLRLYVLSLARIKGQSMMGTLHDGDWTFVWRLPYQFRNPRRGDVVICHFPGRRWKRLPFIPQSFVKRVIGLPGETLEIADGTLYIDGQPISEPYLEEARCRFMRHYGPVTLGPERYFVMGDNRDHSSDSRRVGPLHARDIRGRVVCVLLPLRRMRKIR